MNRSSATAVRPTPTVAAPTVGDRRWLLSAVGIVAVVIGVALRWWPRSALWLDEAQSVAFAQPPAGRDPARPAHGRRAAGVLPAPAPVDAGLRRRRRRRALALGAALDGDVGDRLAARLAALRPPGGDRRHRAARPQPVRHPLRRRDEDVRARDAGGRRRAGRRGVVARTTVVSGGSPSSPSWPPSSSTPTTGRSTWSSP